MENRAVDPDGLLDAAARAVRDWADARVLDIGCGTGFHLPGFAATARSVVGVEPHADLLRLARYRCRGLRNLTLHQATAQRLPVPDGSIDLVHARWAYFFGPGCEPGLREVDRVLAPGGAAVLIDHDARTGTFATWFRREHPTYDPDQTERFWSSHGFTRTPVATRWRFPRRADLEAVLRIEFSPVVAEAMIAALPDLEIDYAANLWWRRKDVGRLL